MGRQGRVTQELQDRVVTTTTRIMSLAGQVGIGCFIRSHRVGRINSHRCEGNEIIGVELHNDDVLFRDFRVLFGWAAKKSRFVNVIPRNDRGKEQVNCYLHILFHR